MSTANDSEDESGNSKNSRRPRTHTRQRKNMYRPLVTPYTYLFFIWPKSNPINLRLIRSSPKLSQLLPRRRIPYPDQRTPQRRRSQ